MDTMISALAVRVLKVAVPVIVGAVGAYVATNFPAVHDAFCVSGR